MAENDEPITSKPFSLDLEIATTFQFTQLPNELLEHLFTNFLSLHDGLNLGKTCHRLYDRFRASCRAARKHLVVVPTDYDYHFDRLHTLSFCSFSATKRLLDENERVDPVDLFRLQSLTLTSVKTTLKPLLTSLLPGLTCLEIFGRPPLIRSDLQELVEAVNALQNLRSLKLYLLFEYEQSSDSTSEVNFLEVRDQALDEQIMDFCGAFLVHLQPPPVHLRHLTLALLGDHFSACTEASQAVPSFEVPPTFLAFLHQLTSISLFSSTELPKALWYLLELIRMHGNEQLLGGAEIERKNFLKVAFTLRPNDCFQNSFYVNNIINPTQNPLKLWQTVELLDTAITALKMNSPITDYGGIDSHLSSQISKLFSFHQLGTIALDCAGCYTRTIEPNVEFRNVINSLSCWAESYSTAEKNGASYQANPHTLLIYLPPPEAFYSENKWRLGMYRRAWVKCFGWFQSDYISPPEPMASVRTVEIVPFRTVVEANVVKQFFLDVAFPQLRRLVVAFDQKEQCELCLVNHGSYQDCGRELVSGFQLLPPTVQQLEVSFEFCYAHLGSTVVRYNSLENMLKDRREQM